MGVTFWDNNHTHDFRLTTPRYARHGPLLAHRWPFQMASTTAEAFYRVAFRIWRPTRLTWFLDSMRVGVGDSILDVGGTAGFWAEMPDPRVRIDALNRSIPPDNEARNHERLRLLVGDGCQLEAADGEYSVAFSNSTIEHVGDFERQAAFAREIRRVGDGVWVQTPAWEFPIEPHFIAPFVQYLPWPLRRIACRWLTPRAWMDRETVFELTEDRDAVRLLSRCEMQQLFPDCEILVERFFGVPKSYIAFRPKRNV